MRKQNFTPHELETMIPLCQETAPEGTHPDTKRWRALSGKLARELTESDNAIKKLLPVAKILEDPAVIVNLHDMEAIPENFDPREAIQQAEQLVAEETPTRIYGLTAETLTFIGNEGDEQAVQHHKMIHCEELILPEQRLRAELESYGFENARINEILEEVRKLKPHDSLNL